MAIHSSLEFPISKSGFVGEKKPLSSLNSLNISMMIRVLLKETNIRKFKYWYEAINSPHLVAPKRNNSIENAWNQWVISPWSFIYDFLFLWQAFHNFKARLKNSRFPPLGKWSGCCRNKAKGWVHMLGQELSCKLPGLWWTANAISIFPDISVFCELHSN